MIELVCHKVEDPRDRKQLLPVVKSVLAGNNKQLYFVWKNCLIEFYHIIIAKQYGYEDVLAPFVVEACLMVMPHAPKAAKINVINQHE